MSNPKTLPKNPIARQKFFHEHFLWHHSVKNCTQFKHEVFLKHQNRLESIKAYSHSPYVPLQIWFDWLKGHKAAQAFFLPYQPIKLPDELYNPFMYYWPPVAADYSDNFANIVLVFNCTPNSKNPALITMMILHDIGESTTASMRLLQQQLEKLHPLANGQLFPEKTLKAH
jgi:hypothetical protein